MLCLGLLLGSIGVSAQAPFLFHQKIAGDSLYLRWEPTDFTAFAGIVDRGMGLAVYAIAGTAAEPDLRLLDRRTLRPEPFATWSANYRGSAWDTIAGQLIHLDRVAPEVREANYPFPDDATPADWRALRLTGTNYALNHYWPSIERAGFGYARGLDPTISTYALQLYPSDGRDTFWIECRPAGYEPPKLPVLEAEFRGRQVELRWRTAAFRRYFFGYSLSKSIDGGRTWTELTELPLVNPQDTLGIEALRYSYFTDTLAADTTEVRYRLRGNDYLGGLSVNYQEVAGSGYEVLRQSPLLIRSEQTDSNYAYLQWEMDPKYESLLREFRIVHTDSVGGIYRTALAGLPASAREAWVPMQYEANFYRVQAVPLRGQPLSSFEALVMAYDAEPPAIPTGLAGQVDTNGVVRLQWAANPETDLAGYRVFKSSFSANELAGITPDPLTTTRFTDTVDMRLGNEWVYYQLQAVDQRGNGSGLSPLLVLKIPDIHPPAPPRIYRTDSDDRTIELAWSASPSPDVLRYRLFRRDLATETDWTLILSFDTTAYRGNYRDSLVTPGSTYAYTLVVTDDAGLDSPPAQPVSLRLKDYGLAAPIQDIDATTQESPYGVTLIWSYPTPPREYLLYRARGDEAMALLKTLPGQATSFLDSAVRRGQTYRYVLRAVDTGGRLSPFTDEIRLSLPE